MESSWPGINDLFSSGVHGPWAPLEKTKKKKKKIVVTCTLSLKDKKRALVISFFLLTPIVSVLFSTNSLFLSWDNTVEESEWRRELCTTQNSESHDNYRVKRRFYFLKFHSNCAQNKLISLASKITISNKWLVAEFTK